MRPVTKENTGGIAERGGNAGIERTDFAKQPTLDIVQRMLGDLGAGEMAHQQGDAVILHLHARGKRRRFRRRNAEPVHAGVDVERRASEPAVRGDERVPLGKLGHAVDDRAGADLGERTRSLVGEAVEHVDRGLLGASAHAARFGEIGHEESLASGVRKRRGDRFEAEPIGVGLDHGSAFAGHDRARKRAPVQVDGGKIDGERAAGAFGIGLGDRRLG